MFHSEPFFYTLTPPRLAADPVDGFLFDTKRGFCGHYASAFATLMRAAGIPARVVTGYQGGTYNRFADYWILRQSDAHAWDEVWIERSGWVRVDPTTCACCGANGSCVSIKAPRKGSWSCCTFRSPTDRSSRWYSRHASFWA
jgi:hypothetical protein